MTTEPKKKPHDTEKTIFTAIERSEVDQKQAYILFLSGPLVGKLHMLADGPTIIGRSPDATLCVNDNRVSRHHTKITLQGGRAVLTDLGSTNGTYVNGQKADQHPLQDGDKVQLSSATIFKFALQDQTENVFHKELYKMAVVDAVTNIYNRRYLLERLKEEFSHARRMKKPLSLLILDIDFFKQVNDTHGHLAGDLVLHQVAQRLQASVRAEDLLARYGGEEFAILQRDADAASALGLAERLRTAVGSAPMMFEQTPILVTISLGVATITVDRTFDSTEAFIQCADDALYQSKQHGRNRVTVG